VWDLIDSFFSTFNISFILREENVMVDSLAISTRNFRPPLPPKLRYDIEVRYRPFIPNNIKYWKVFEDDLEIIKFLEFVDDSPHHTLIEIMIPKLTLKLMYS